MVRKSASTPHPIPLPASGERGQEPLALVTGFEPFGGFRSNPSAEIAAALDGTTLAGVRIVGRVLPVDFGKLDRALRAALRAAGPAPVAAIALGLAAGEPVVRLERVAVNLADFSIADNSGRQVRDRPITKGGPAARATRLPLPALQRALLDAGIPARLSNSAGTYLCNAAMYRLLEALPETVPCGFVHLPAAAGDIARRLAENPQLGGETGLAQLASMDPATMRRGVEIVIATTLRRGPAGRPAGGSARA